MGSREEPAAHVLLGTLLVPEFQSACLEMIVYVIYLKSPAIMLSGCSPFIRAIPEMLHGYSPTLNQGESVADASGRLCL
jgi:hypothetical protein